MIKIPTFVSVKPFVNKALRVAGQNLPKIFAGCALGCLCGAVYTTAKGTVRATEIIAEEEKRRSESLPEYENKELTTLDKISLTWKEYVPAFCCTTAAAGFIIASERKGHEKYVAMLGAYSLSQQALAERKEAEREVLTEDDVKLVNERARLKVANSTKTSEPIVNVSTDGDELLYIESHTRLPFYAKECDVQHAFNMLNRICNMSGSATISDLLDDLDLRTSPSTDIFGWRSDYGSLLEPVYLPVFFDNDPSKPAVLIEYSIDPEYNCGIDKVQY